MRIYFALKIKSYVSLTYADLPFIHYNAPGPKPWAANAPKAFADPGKRQHCDFIWWSSFLQAKSHYPRQALMGCRKLLLPRLSRKRAAGHFVAPSCCRVCPGGGHFATAQPCAESKTLGRYAVENCHVVAELLMEV